jgi:ParB family protein of integrating conjugative element (PFGI_1 class)
MAKARPDLGDRLAFGHGHGAIVPAETAEPVLPILMVRIFDIQAYERNPRRSQNPRYAEIKDSIRKSGMETALPITRRPGSTKYTLRHGGNTRLKILQELYEETREERFLTVPCKYRQWETESSNLISHLQENDQRGELRLIDRARGVREISELLQEELGAKFSHRTLSTALEERGYRLSPGYISRLWYALDVLVDALPKALEAGLGGQTVVRIRSLEKALHTVWKALGTRPKVAFERHWHDVLRGVDAEVFEFDELRKRVLADLIKVSGEDPAWLRASLSAAMSGKPLPERPGESTAHLRPAEQTAPAADPSMDLPPVGINPGSQERLSATAGGGEGESNAPRVMEHVPRVAAVGDGAPLLRARAFQLAATLAQRHHIGDLVVPLNGQGCGFILTDVVDPSLREALGAEAYERISTLWWHLVSCAELTAIPAEQASKLLPVESVFRRALETRDLDLVLDHVATLDPGQFGRTLWQRLADDDWQMLLELLSVYRALYKSVQAEGRSLWDTPSGDAQAPQH